MNWRAAMRWARAHALSCRTVINQHGVQLDRVHRHKVVAATPSSRVGPWTYEIHCTNEPSRYRPTR